MSAEPDVDEPDVAELDVAGAFSADLSAAGLSCPPHAVSARASPATITHRNFIDIPFSPPATGARRAFSLQSSLSPKRTQRRVNRFQKRRRAIV